MAIRALTAGLVSAGLLLASSWPPAAAADYDETKTVDPKAAFSASGVTEFFIVTVHVDGKTSVKGDAMHPPEPIPKQALPAGGGILRSAADEAGRWRMRAFTFLPSQVVVREGDRVRLTFVGVQGPAHRIAVEGQGDPITLKRGEARSIEFVAERAGLVRFASLDRLPSMRGSVLVLPR